MYSKVWNYKKDDLFNCNSKLVCKPKAVEHNSFLVLWSRRMKITEEES